ncbi:MULTISPECIES: LamG domain-containing protein [Methylomonas]|nr:MULTISPECIES: LamG domain-containing protein [Methylomonas]TCV78286.1 concanavalin A-like lectin/glucanase superfamily protein [Methylomonas methanica]
MPTVAYAGRVINSATLNGATSITVTPGATITASLNVTTSSTDNTWLASGWLISTSVTTGTGTCANHANYLASGTFNQSFTITAPNTAGTYNAYFAAYSADNCGTGQSVVYTLSNAVIVATAPAVSSINLAGASPTTTGTSVSWTVVFNKSVTGVDASDFSLVQSGGASGAAITSVTGSGSSWTVTASSGSTAGSLGLNLVDDDSIKYASSIPLGGTGIGNDNFTGQVYTVTFASLPILDFHMDEAAWNGTANEVIDSESGYSGTAATLTGSKPSTASTVPVSAGSPGTCGYGVFNRNNKNYVALPSSFPNLGATGGAFTIAAWIRTTNNTLPGQRIFIDDEHNSSGYGFSLADGGNGKVRFFSRGTPSVESLDTANVIANNTWYFVAAVVDVPNKTKRIYVFNTAGTLLANVSATWTETSFGSDSGIASIGGETNAAGENNNSFGFAGNIDELRVFQSALTQSSIQSLMSRTRSCTIVSPVLVNPVDFNCVEAGQSELTGHLYGKLSGTSFTFDVIALKDTNNDGIAEGALTTYASDVTRNVTVELVDGSGSTACRSRTALSPIISQTLSFAKASQPSEQGRKSTASFTVAKAYANLRCRVTDATNSPSIVGCSADSFSIRPTTFSVSASANGSSAIKTGASFSMTAASGVVGYDGSPKADPSKLNAHSGAIRSGMLTGTFDYADLTTGTATGSDFIYSEVGYFNLSAQGVYDDNFTEVDAVNSDCTSDFANTAVSGKFGCKFGNTATTGNFGRFIPDHFDVTLNTPLFAPSCNSFTYVGQPIKYAMNPVVTVTAKNADAGTTQNYTGSYWKIDPSHATYGITPSYSEATQSLTVLNSSAPVVADNGNGTGTLTFADTSSNILGITRGNPLATFNAEIAMSFTLRDTDAVQVTNINGVAGGNPVAFGSASAGNGIGFSNGYKAQRWGRLTLSNAYGSELAALPMPLFSEYFNGSAFVTNTADNCTSLSLTNQIQLSNSATASGALKAGNTAMTILPSGTSTATLANTPLLAGVAGLSFSAPGAGNTGYIDVSGSFGSLPWLLFDWDHNGVHDNSPAAKASFGIYKGGSQQIYLREVY